MADPTTLISSVRAELALRDTQVDEYYDDISAGALGAAFKSLAKNPYPGLRPFKTSESVVFFGREGISVDIVSRLASCGFLAVLGASGTGKSSLVRAGLLPSLDTLPARYADWKIVICRPGKNPFGNLARALSAAGMAPSKTELDIWKIISCSSFGYEQLYDSINDINYNTLIIIDQFEEIFRYRTDYGISGRNDAALFVKMMIETSQNTRLNTRVLITMRSEYLGDCVQLPQLVDAINNGQYLVPRLKTSQLIDTIVEPTKFSRAIAAPGYAQALISEIGDSMDQLPVLQHVLMRAYEHAAGKTPPGERVLVSYDNYVAVGGMEKALDKHAKEVFDGLSPKQQEYCKILFQSLTDKTTDGRGIRRPLSFDSILAICEEKEKGNRNPGQVRSDLEITINSFRKDNINFLMPPPHVPLSGELEIDISHESLMRIWSYLQQWMAEEARDVTLLNNLLQRDKTEYLKGGRLLIYKEWLETKKPGLTWASLYKPANLTAETYQEKFSQAKELVRRSRRRQNLGAILVIAVITIIVSSLAANYYYRTRYSDSLQERNNLLVINETTTRKHNALLSAANSRVTEMNDSLLLANRRVSFQYLILSKQGEQLRRAGANLVMQKLELSKTNKDLVAKNALVNLQANTLLNENAAKQTALNALKLTQDSLEMVSEFTNLKNIALESISIPVYDLKREDIKAYLALIAYQLYEASNHKDKKLQAESQVYSALYFALRNKVVNDAANPDTWKVTPYPLGMDFLASGAVATTRDNQSIMYLTAEDKRLYSFDFGSQKINLPKSIINGNKLVGIQASDKGWIALNTLSNKVVLRNPGDALKDSVLTLKETVRTMKFSPDGNTLYVQTQDNTFTSVNLATREITNQKIPFRLEDLAISNSHIYGLSSTGDVIRWSKGNRTLADPLIFPSENNSISGRGTVINCTPDNSLVVWGNENGQVFYLKGGKKVQYLTRFSGPVTSIAFNDSFRSVALSSFDKTIQVFNLPNLQSEVPLSLNNNEGPVNTLFFQKDREGKENLVAVISPGIIRMYPMDLDKLACRLYEFFKDKQPPAEDLEVYIDKSVPINKVAIKCR